MNIFIDWNGHWIKIRDYFSAEFSITLYLVGPMECICLISFLQQENTKQPHGGIESWQLNFPSLFIIQWQSFKMTPGTQKINYHVIFHAVVVHSVCLHVLSINTAGCSVKEMWAHTQVLLETKSRGDKVCVYLSCNSCFDLFHRVPSWDLLVFSLWRTSSSLFVNECKIFRVCSTVFGK